MTAPDVPPLLTSPLLSRESTIDHAFFGREGGISEAPYTSLNTGPGSNDRAEHVIENRRRCSQMFATPESHLCTLKQIHSADIHTLTAPFSGERPTGDGMVTTTPGLMLGILTADCMPFLFHDPQARVIGAAHAGWRGALAGVLENTMTAMEALGAQSRHIRAVLGPCLRQEQFEVGMDLVEAFLSKYPAADRFFIPGLTSEKRQFDLAAFGKWRLAEVGIREIDDISLCTMNNPYQYFSYRMSRRMKHTDYGRNLSAIMLRS